MANYITIDGGTTNTRVFLVMNGKVVASKKVEIGARMSANGTEPLCKALKENICELLEKNNLCENDVTAILASGMITSEYGLCEIPHLVIPVSAKKIHAATKQILIPSVCSIPFVFIPGAKTPHLNLCDADMMRGEETEVFGLATLYGDGAYLLPGSHSKLMILENGYITSIKTMMTGEMIAALSGNTILKDAVDLSLDEYDEKYLIMGYESSEKLGINEALFKTRILKNLFGATAQQTYGFFLGVCLADEIKAVISSGTKKVVIGGKRILKKAIAETLVAKSDIQVTTATDKDVDDSTPLGAVKIYEA